ncbi:SPRY domain protein [Ancylostoma caninum]|uniref:SPRY domain protein n=1 Tax=Ancylostoma caninum TaxID=29170 RepID=A0A368H1G1_ANCCA|nr:SPRY domain protein [Ancylostoma caninum]
MSSRPRRSCARGDTSVLSPSTIFLWSDTRLRQELTRRGLSRVGIRQDLIDRLLDSINGKITEEPSVSSENALDTSRDQGSSQEAVETPTTVPNEAAAGSSTKRRGKRSAPVRSDSAPQPSKKKSKTSKQVKEEPESPIHSNETPAARPRRQRRPRAAAGEDVALPKEVAPDVPPQIEQPSEEVVQVKSEVPDEPISAPAEPSPTCSIMKPILSILPKVRPLPCLTVEENSASRTSSSDVGSTTSVLNSVKTSPESGSEKLASQAPLTSAGTRSASSDEDSPSPAKIKILSKRSSIGVLSSRRRGSIGDNATTQGQALHSRKMSQQKDEEERHHVKRHSVTNTSSKAERISTHKPITEAWAERLAQLKKTNPTKFAAAATTSKEKQKEREDREEKQKDREIRKKSVPSSTSTELKKSAVAATGAAGNGLDLLDSILSQQSVFLQTMRRSEDRNSPEIIREVRRSEPTGEVVENTCLERSQDMSATALEAYKRFEQSCAESSSVKNSPKSPQLLPPPPPPPKPAPQHISSKKVHAVGVEVSRLLVPPPPPPPPPPQPPKDIPPPPPPRRPRVTPVEQLPPPPPPPKRLKPVRPSAPPKASNSHQEAAAVGEVKRLVPIPFSQRNSERIPVVEPRDKEVTTARDVESSSKTEKDAGNIGDVEKPENQEGVQEDEEEYDPLETSAVDGFENYVPSAVVSRDVTLDDLVASQTPELEINEPPAEERYSPAPAQAAPGIDEDDEEEEVLDDVDSDIESLSDDSEDDSEGENEELPSQTFLRQDETGRIIKVTRRTKKRTPVVKNTTPNCSEPANPSEEQPAVSVTEKEEVEKKPDPSLLNDPRHLLQRASAVLQGLGKKEDSQYSQMPYDEEYEEEECVQPMDSFHGEPVPDDDDLFEVAAGIKPKRKEEVIIEEKVPTSTEQFEIDFCEHNGDLHLKGAPDNDWIIDPDNQDGLALVWGGVRSTHGIKWSPQRMDTSECENGSDKDFLKSIVFQVKITDLLPTRHLPFDELDPNDIRVGFSLRSAPLVLGEYPGSYCFTSLGKRANNNLFTDYGEPFTVGDVVTAHMDFEKGNISFWKNNECLGEAFSNIVIPEDEALYPHICVKNCRVSVNFGTFPGGEEEWVSRPEWVFPNALPSSQTERAPVPPESKSDCTVLMMVGLPSVGKTTWVRRYIREHPSEHWTLISADTILASMKVNGVSRNSSHIGRWDMVLGLVGKARNRLLSLAARRRRNYILDFTNCDPDTRKKRLALFEGFFRQCVTIVPSDEVMQQRHARHLRQNRGEGTAAVPIETFLELKAVMEMPVVSEFLESVIYVDPAMEDAQIAIDRIAKFNEEGRPWYSSKYNKKRGYWSGTYGDEPYRKSSSTTTRPQVSSVSSNVERSSTDTAPAPVTTTNSIVSPVAASEVQKPEERPPVVNGSTKAREELPIPAAITSGVAAISLQTPAPPVSAASAPLVSPSVVNSNNLLTTAPPPTFNVPPPVIAPQTPQPVDVDDVCRFKRVVTQIATPKAPLASPVSVPVPVTRQTTSIPVVQQAAPVPVIAQPAPIAIVPPPPFQMSTPSNHSSPIAVQISNYSPRNRWDAPPPAIPNFSVPPPSVPPPSLVMPNLYVPNAVPAMIPLIPNTSIPPPNVPPTNLPPPGWPPRLS